MPKLACPCGFVHNLSPIPDDGWLTIPDRAYEPLMEAEARGGALDENMDTAADKIYRESVGRLYECPKCARLMWEKPNESVFRVFEPMKDPAQPNNPADA